MKKILLFLVGCFAYTAVMAQKCDTKLCPASKCQKQQQNVTYNISEEDQDGKITKQHNIIINDGNGKVKAINIETTDGAAEVHIAEGNKTQSYSLKGTEAEINAELKRLGIDLNALLHP